MQNNLTQQPTSISGRIGAGGKRIVDSLVMGLSSLRIHPNVLTLIGMVINIFAMVLFAKGIFLWAGLVIVFAGIFDIVDGEVARRTKRVTKFGAFFDSVIDRYSDLLLLLGLIIWYAKIDRIFYVGLTGLVLIGSVLTRSEEHTSELQSQSNLVCRLLLEKKNTGVRQAHWTLGELS